MYEFKCDKCGKKFEELIRNNDPDPNCPECGSAAHRLLSACRRVRASQGDTAYAPTGGGCSGCSGGNCGSCGR